MANLICLGGGVESVPIIQRVKEMGHRAVVVDKNNEALAFSIADRAVVASCYDADEACEAIRDDQWSHAHIDYGGVLCCAVDAPVVAAEISREYGLPGISVEASLFGQNKYAQKYELERLSINIPLYAVPVLGIKKDGSTECLIDNNNGWVIKPVDSRGGRGVIRVTKSVDPTWAYRQTHSQTPTGRVMIEQWLDGPQLSTESIIQDGQVLFTAVALRNYARLNEFAPYVIEDGSDTPADLDRETLTEIDHTINKACRALGWYQDGAGTVKGDLVIHDGRVYVIELAPRLSGGFFASHIIPLAYGVDIVGADINAALGKRIEASRVESNQFVCQRYVFPDKDDIGKTVVRIGDARIDVPLEYLKCATWNLRNGQTINPVTSHPDRWGQVITTGTTPNEARQRAETAVKAMKESVILE